MTRQQNDFGTVIFERERYTLQAQAEPTSRLLPAPLTNYAEAQDGEEFNFEMAAPAIGSDDQAYEITWIFTDIKGQEKELDAYDYDAVCMAEPVDRPVYLVKMARCTEDAWDETHADPKVIHRTLDLEQAHRFEISTEPILLNSHDLDGRPYYLAPVIIRKWGDEETMLD